MIALPGGRWQAVISVTGPDRKRYRRKATADTQQQALALKDELREKYADGLAVDMHRAADVLDADTITVADWLDRWIAKHSGDVAPTTAQSYRSIIEQHLKPDIRRIGLARLTAWDVEVMITAKKVAGLSPRTGNTSATLRKALTDARKAKLIATNPAASADAPKLGEPEINHMTFAEVGAFLDAAQGDDLEYLYTVSLHVGRSPR